MLAPRHRSALLLFILLASVVVSILRSFQEIPNPIDNEPVAARQAQQQQIKEPDNNKLLVFIGYLSAPSNHEKRNWLRKTCFPKIRDACLEFNTTTTTTKFSNATKSDIHPHHKGQLGWGTSCDGRFFIGHPNDPSAASTRQGKKQGVFATEMEIELAQSLQHESDIFGDIQMLPMRDSYFELPDKTLSILRHGLLLQNNNNNGGGGAAESILKIDDDHCPNMTKVLSIASTTPRNVARYVGFYRWKGTEYTIMKGADGSIDPYMSGPGYLVSRALAQAVAVDDINHSVLYMPYGSSSEDVDMGKWFAHANRTHPELEFVYEVVKDLIKKVSEGS